MNQIVPDISQCAMNSLSSITAVDFPHELEIKTQKQDTFCTALLLLYTRIYFTQHGMQTKSIYLLKQQETIVNKVNVHVH